MTALAPVDPAAPLAQMSVDEIIVRDRHRRDLGDLDDLVASIRDLGVLQPILVMPNGRLVAGQRRLQAARQAGLVEVPVVVTNDLTDASALLRAERDENTCRKEMTRLELMSLTDALLKLERPKAKERQVTAIQARDEQGRATSAPGNGSGAEGYSVDLAAKAAGWSRASYERTKFVAETATDPAVPDDVRALAERELVAIDAGGPIQPAATRVANAKQRAERPHGRRHAVHGRAHYPRANDTFERAVIALDGICRGLRDLDVAQLDETKVRTHQASLAESIRTLRRLHKEITSGT